MNKPSIELDLEKFERLLNELQTALDTRDFPRASALLRTLRPADQADVLGELDEADQLSLLPELHPAETAGIFAELDEEMAAELAGALPTETVIRIVDEMEPDEAADLLGDIEPHQARAVLEGLEDPEEIRPLLLHPDESAGGLMTSQFLALRRRMTAADALQAIREWNADSEAISELFVVDAHNTLVGAVSLWLLVTSNPEALLLEILDPDILSVRAGTDQEEVARLMSRYDLLSLPVVDAQNHLLGVITVDDVMDVLEDEATEDIHRMGGAQPLDRPYLDTSVFDVTRKRIGWLLLLFVTGSLTASVMRHFEHELQTAVALAFFVPLLIGTGGNAGSQSTSTIIRALAVGDIDLRDAVYALWHELRAGLLLGGGMAAVAYFRARLWGGVTTAMALTVSASILAIVIWANGLGALLPLLAVKLKIDPTVVSGPAMSTLVDATGLFIYFSIARALLGL
jgi:magnesium transporter